MRCTIDFIRTKKVGFFISYAGIFILLVWIGIFKFTPTEADMIKPMVENHPFMSWLYKILSVQGVSNLIGTVELITALMMILALRWEKARQIAALMIIGTLLVTLSFIITTPGVWKVVDGVLVTDFFLLKDIPMLGVGLVLLSDSIKS